MRRVGVCEDPWRSVFKGNQCPRACKETQSRPSIAMAHFFYLTPEILLPFSPLTSQEFELIRRKAGASWQSETRWSASSPTTYAGSYRRKDLEGPTDRRFSAEAVQHWPECPQISSPNSSACTLTLCRAGPQDTAGFGGLLPHLPSSCNKPMGVGHRVTHQILWGDFSPVPPNHGKSYVRSKKPAYENPMKHSQRRTAFPRRPPVPCNSASKAGSSEDSDADQYYVYSLGGPLEALS
ncbi:uncharacterized protein C4orf51 homolog isoform X2 [Sturnira hondurensis]|uniref:uncharacterized protein C4orf51 homolog isoform X2 n=1 Tax=Sturnira hondurensis TaxID=192404 RepID=UPI00187993C1|nr:uncharacterized protein C4orf51 homolog isoform X2 [Sturnira hondurensis]